MSFKKKQFLGFGVILLMMFALFSTTMYMLNSMKVNLDTIMNDRFSKVERIIEFRRHVSLLDNELGYMMNERSTAGAKTRIAAMDDRRRLASEELEKLRANLNTERGRELYARTVALFNEYTSIQGDIATLAKAGKWDEASASYLGAYRGYINPLLETVEEFKEFQKTRMNEKMDASKQGYFTTVTVASFAGMATLILAVIGALWLTRSTTRSLRKIAGVVNRVDFRSDEALPRLYIRSKDELGNISTAFNNMAEALESYREIERQYQRRIEEQNWQQSRLAEVAIMYQGITNLNELADAFIRKVASMIGAAYGVFYLVKDRNRLVKAGSFASDGGDPGTEAIRSGEGLVGQAMLEKRILRLKGVPSDYIKIESGLGSAPAQHVLVAPVQWEGRVLAVIELAALEPFGDREEELLRKLLETLGVSIDSIAGRMEVERLLAEAQAMTEELQAQSHELQTQSEELQSQSEEMQMQAEELRITNEQLEERTQDAEEKARILEKMTGELKQQAEELEESSRYKSEFLANMSHELRTPLNSILILSQMLMENRKKHLSQEEEEYSRVIHNSGNDLLNLINDILDLSKIEAGKVELKLGELSLVDLPDIVQSKFQHVARKGNLAFRIVKDSGLPDVLYTDGLRLEQILKNLLSNAFKFTEKGTVTMRIYRPTVEEMIRTVIPQPDGQAPAHPVFGLPPADGVRKLGCENPDMVAFSVTDTGIGVPEAKRSVIFEAFQQADGATSRKYGGTGLGLSICRQLAQLLGGWMGMESREGVGSTFVLYLPVRLANANELDKPTSEVAAATRELSSVRTEAAAAVQDPVAIPVQAEDSGKDPSPQGFVDAEGRLIPLEAENLSSENGMFRNKRVLIVDDDVRNVFALTVALENQGMRVDTAGNGREAIEMLGKDPSFDLILMDVMMPEIDGFAATRQIREGLGLHTPIIAVTAKAMKNDREKCLEAGASDYISKPLNLERLFSVMRVWLA